MRARASESPGLPSWAPQPASGVAFAWPARSAVGIALGAVVALLLFCCICSMLARSGRRGAEHMRAAHERRRAYGDDALLAEQQLSLLGLRV